MTLEFQEALLKDINKDLVLTNSNLKESSTEINHQGDQINNTLNKIQHQQHSNKTNKNISIKMNNSILEKTQVHATWVFFVYNRKCKLKLRKCKCKLVENKGKKDKLLNIKD